MDYHSKIASRLFKILEELLAKHQEEQEAQRIVKHADKQSQSTRTSMCPSSLHRHTSPS